MAYEVELTVVDGGLLLRDPALAFLQGVQGDLRRGREKG